MFGFRKLADTALLDSGLDHTPRQVVEIQWLSCSTFEDKPNREFPGSCAVRVERIAVLDEVKQRLGEPKSIRYMNVREVQADLVRRVAAKQAVSDRQVRNYLYSLRNDLHSKNIESLRELSTTEPERRRGQECAQLVREVICSE